MLETRSIEIYKVPNPQDLALKLNEEITKILKNGGQLEAYSVLSMTNWESGAVGATFMVTFSDLDSDIGISAEMYKWPLRKK